MGRLWHRRSGGTMDALTLTRPLANDDMAKAVAFLTSDEAEMITAAELAVDVGLMIRAVLLDYSEHFAADSG